MTTVRKDVPVPYTFFPSVKRAWFEHTDKHRLRLKKKKQTLLNPLLQPTQRPKHVEVVSSGRVERIQIKDLWIGCELSLQNRVEPFGSYVRGSEGPHCDFAYGFSEPSRMLAFLRKWGVPFRPVEWTKGAKRPLPWGYCSQEASRTRHNLPTIRVRVSEFILESEKLAGALELSDALKERDVVKARRTLSSDLRTTERRIPRVFGDSYSISLDQEIRIVRRAPEQELFEYARKVLWVFLSSRVANSAYPCFRMDGYGQADFHYHIGDLLGALYHMVCLDMCGDTLYYHCQFCGKRFQPKRRNNIYCDMKCKSAKNSTTYRNTDGYRKRQAMRRAVI